MTKPDPAFDALKKDPKAAQLLGDGAALKSILSSPRPKSWSPCSARQEGTVSRPPPRRQPREGLTPSWVS